MKRLHHRDIVCVCYFLSLPAWSAGLEPIIFFGRVVASGSLEGVTPTTLTTQTPK